MTKLAAAVFACFVLTASSVFAVDLSQIGSGAKPISLGRAYVGFAEDSYSMLTNPAGMADISSIEITSLSSNIMEDEQFAEIAREPFGHLVRAVNPPGFRELF